MQKPSISIVGPGNLGTALAEWLYAAGYRIDEIVARPKSRSRARALARRVQARAVAVERATFTAEVIWLSVPDDAIAACAYELADRAAWKGKTVLHSSGALTSAELVPLRDRGAMVGSMHPMMTFVRAVRPPSPAGVSFAIEGDTQAMRVARAIVRDLGGEVLQIKSEHKPLYHALGAFASPLLVAELSVAENVARAVGIADGKARRAIAPIVRKTLENYLAGGPAAAFSGPLIRGDVGTIRKHLQVLKAVPGAREAYVALARAAIRNLPVGNRDQIQTILRRGDRQKMQRTSEPRHP